MKKILVFGGTRFFGKKLIDRLIEKGCDVTIATRGNTADDFGDRVKRVQLDRSVDDFRWDQLREQKWDVVYDNICYNHRDAEIAVNKLSGKTEKYIFTSTLSVYDFTEKALVEEDFSPYDYALPSKDAELNYAEGKRAAEAYFFQKSDLNVTAMRIPIVLGVDDYTKRLHWHIEKIAKGEEIGFPNIEAKMGFVSSDEAADALFWLKDQPAQGPINICSEGILSLKELIGQIEKETGKSVILAKNVTEKNHSPFGVPKSWYMSLDQAKAAGYKPKELQTWLFPLIKTLEWR